MTMQYQNIDFFVYLLNEIHYWNEEKEEKAIPVDEDILNEEQIKREMLQWATGRGL